LVCFIFLLLLLLLLPLKNAALFYLIYMCGGPLKHACMCTFASCWTWTRVVVGIVYCCTSGSALHLLASGSRARACMHVAATTISAWENARQRAPCHAMLC
jgi:hypothetical protein